MTWKNATVLEPPPRPIKDGYGTVGRKIQLTTNHFPVTVKNPNLKLYHYDVTIKDSQGNEKLPKSKKMLVFEQLKMSYPKVFSKPLAFDSVKNAYGVDVINQLKSKKAQNYEVILGVEDVKQKASPDDAKNKRNKYTLTLQLVNQASLKDLLDSFKRGGVSRDNSTMIQMCEIMFRHYRSIKYTQVSGRNFFGLDGEFGRPNPIGGGKEGVVGFFASLRPAAWKDGTFMLNIDLAHTAFYKEQPVIEFLKESIQLDERDLFGPLNFDMRKKAVKQLKMLRIRVNHSNIKRTYKVLDLTTKGADQLEFEVDSPGGAKRKTTVQRYMMDQYKYNLKYPKALCLHVGNPAKKIYIPLEVCNIDKGQKVQKKLSDTETAAFIRSTAIPPADRLRQIKNAAKINKFGEDPMLQALTFQIADMPLQTEGRVLDAPNLTMKTKTIQPRQGVWDVRGHSFHAPAKINKWAVISYDARTRTDTIRNFIKVMRNEATGKGMEMVEPADLYEFKERRDPTPLADLKYYKEKFPDIQLVLCILPGKNIKYYGGIKMAGDKEIGLVTQCVLGQNVFKCSPQTVVNILMKINAKMGGVNNIVGRNPSDLLAFKEPFLILGADVNHPPAGDKFIPSIAAVVGSCDSHATQYAVEVRAQKHRVEIIMDMTEIVINLLKTFYKKTRVKPSRIIMYRDGVSESQFAEVLSGEMMKIRDACKFIQKDGSYQPGITYICVQKRHHTRFFCTDTRDGVGKSGNVPPGTVVDRDITHPSDTDFYLCSHQGIQGTSRPTHYHVLWDDNDLPMNELQAVTYKLCHVYSRCSRSVSIPTPAYYAHLAAFRAKVHINEKFGDSSDTMSTRSGGSGEEHEIPIGQYQSVARVAIDSTLGSVLYYV